VRLCLDFQAWVVGRSVWNLLRALDREVEYLPFPVLGGLMSSWRSFSGFPALKTNAFRWYRCFVCFPLLLQDAKFRKKKRIAGRRAWATGTARLTNCGARCLKRCLNFLLAQQISKQRHTIQITIYLMRSWYLLNQRVPSVNWMNDFVMGSECVLGSEIERYS
jgi:hypothetical protein